MKPRQATDSVPLQRESVNFIDCLEKFVGYYDTTNVKWEAYMHICKKLITLLLITMLCCLTTGCGKDPNSVSNIAYGDIVYDRIGGKNSRTDDSIYTRLYKTYEEANADLPNFGTSQSALSVYDEAYFTDNDLLFFTFATNTDYAYTVKSLWLEGDVLKVNVDERVPEVRHLVLGFKAVFIDIPKDSLPEDVKIEVWFNPIIVKVKQRIG